MLPEQPRRYCQDHYSCHQVPEYLQQNYWWAYLSPVGVAIFDHPFMVDRILWGNYQAISAETIQQVSELKPNKVTGISCAYGNFIPDFVQQVAFQQFNLFDVARIQLEHAIAKLPETAQSSKVNSFLADAEAIPLANNYADVSLLFFLLHELPEAARERVLTETIRTTNNDGYIVIADYAPMGQRHWFHRFSLFRQIFEFLEPCLGQFWRSDIELQLQQLAKTMNKSVVLHQKQFFWHDFYQLTCYRVCDD